MITILCTIYLTGAIAMATYRIAAFNVLLFKVSERQLVRTGDFMMFGHLVRVILWPIVLVASYVVDLFRGV